jgi:hypothetical protein
MSVSHVGGEVELIVTFAADDIDPDRQPSLPLNHRSIVPAVQVEAHLFGLVCPKRSPEVGLGAAVRRPNRDLDAGRRSAHLCDVS